ncbi:MAG: DUF2934 domain-containing protein [Terriglobales bacterium]|jgi:hypothetical protein
MKLEKKEFEPKSMSSMSIDRPVQSLKTPSDMEEQVRRRAYELYVERGSVDGFEVEDWLQAEAELLGARRTGRAA